MPAIFVLVSLPACATDPAVSPSFAFRESALERDSVEDPLPGLRACWNGPESAFPPAGVKRCSFQSFLDAMGEETLSRPGVQEAYRFLWLRTWRRPLMVRVERTERGDVSLEAKETDGSSELAPGKLAEHGRRRLTAAEWHSLKEAIQRSAFWTMDPAARVGTGGVVVADGATWIVEGHRGGGQRTLALDTAHVVEAELEENAALRDAALLMLEFAGVDVSQLAIY